MLRFIVQMFQKLLAKDWGKIFESWIWIYQYVKRYWLQIVIYTVLGLVGTVFDLISSVVSKNLIDAVTGFNTDSIGWTAAMFVGLGVSRVFINMVTGKISLLIQIKVSNEIRVDVFDQVMCTDWESMSGYSTGDLLVRISGDAGTISNSVLSFIPNVVTTFANFVGAFVIVCYHDPWMALLALGGAPVTVLTSRYRLTKMQQYQRESQKMSSKKMAFDQETFQNVQSIKAFGLIDLFSQKMKQIQAEALDLSLRQYKYQAWSTIIMSLTGMAVSYGCYGFAVYRLWRGDITYGTMTLFVSMASSLTGSFSSVVNLIPTAIRAATSAERIIDIVSLPRESYADKEKAEKIRDNSRKQGVYVRMEGVDFSYKDGRAVYRNASLHADPGEIVALIGPSGQGKTTTLRMLLGLIQPEKGKLEAGNPRGKSLEISPSTRCLFSYVPQENTMFSGTIAENLHMVKPEATDQELQEALEVAHAWGFVSKLENGMDTKVGERGLGFSEGQNQRLSIARALLADAPILLLDEATSALDVATERRVLRSIMKKDPYRTVILTAHRPSVFSMCSRVYKIEEGAVQEVDSEGIRQFLDAF
ncbi:MAG: ABC transporter ATP-binding protein [Lachnospiraceae bacterium]